MSDISKITLPNNEEYNLKDSKSRENFARVNTSSTADTTYYQGDYLVYNGTLYRAKETISQGVTLSVGNNIEASVVSTDIKALKNSKADKNATIPAARFFDSADTTRRSIHIPNSARFIFICATANMNFVGAWLGISFSGGAVQRPAAMYAPGGVSFDVSIDNTLTVITTQARQLEMCILLINGSNTSDYYII